MAYAQTTVEGFSGADFRIGQVASKSLQVFSRNIVTYSLIAALTSIPSIALAFVEPTGSPDTKAIIGIASFILILFFTPLATAVNLHAAFQSMRGRPVRLGESVARGLARFVPLLGVMFLFAIGVGVGFLLLVVPGIILIVMWYVSVPACVVERTGPIRSLGRSRELTKGYRWKIFGLVLLVYIVSAVGAAVAGGLGQILGGLIGQVGAQLIWQAVIGGFGTVLIAVIYYYLRVAKEGVDVDQIASVFD